MTLLFLDCPREKTTGMEASFPPRDGRSPSSDAGRRRPHPLFFSPKTQRSLLCALRLLGFSVLLLVPPLMERPPFSYWTKAERALFRQGGKLQRDSLDMEALLLSSTGMGVSCHEFFFEESEDPLLF